MATYEEIYGKRVKEFDSDPTLDSSYEGQVWYDKSTGNLKTVVAVEAWSSAGALATGRYNHTGVGSDTAGLVFGGDTGPPPETRRAETEEYNGTGWAASSTMNTTRDLTGGFGIQTAAATAGGRSPSAPSGTNNTEHYDGSSWTAVPGTLNTTRFGAGGFGTQTAGAVCGCTPPTTNATEEYNGSAWTSVNNMNNSVSSLQSATAGTQTSAIRVAGYPNSNTIELYDGTNWTNSPATLNTARFSGSYQGTQTAGFYAGGQLFPPNAASAATETWDGTSMTTSPATLAAIQYYHTGSKGSPSTSGWVCGGQTPAATNNTTTQEYNFSTTVITADAYAALPNLNNARDVEGFGSKNGTTTAALVGNGGVPPNGMSNYTEEFDGSSWTAGGNLPGSWRHSGGTGIQTAALCVGGFNGPSNLNGVYHYGGSSWTSGGNYPVAQYAVSVAGTQTAAIAAGGGSDTTPANTYNGSSWTSAGTMSIGRSWFGSAGSTTAALVIGGNNAPTGQCEEYDGSSWTSGGNMASGRTQVTTCSFGTQTAAGQAGANTPVAPAAGKINYLQTYNGTSWLTGANMATSRNNGSGTGTTSSHLVAAGYGPGSTYQNTAEEFTTGSSAIPAKTLTTS